MHDDSFAGHREARISGWLLVPYELDADVPVIVEFVGYQGGRGVPVDWLSWSCAGFAQVVMDSPLAGASPPTPNDPSRRGEPIPHMFNQKTLCVHFRYEYDATRMLLADTIVPWTSEWLLHYEILLLDSPRLADTVETRRIAAHTCEDRSRHASTKGSATRGHLAGHERSVDDSG